MKLHESASISVSRSLAVAGALLIVCGCTRERPVEAAQNSAGVMHTEMQKQPSRIRTVEELEQVYTRIADAEDSYRECMTSYMPDYPEQARTGMYRPLGGNGSGIPEHPALRGCADEWTEVVLARRELPR